MFSNVKLLPGLEIEEFSACRFSDWTIMTVKYEGIEVLNWFEERSSASHEPHFTTLDQDGYENWYVLAHDGEWRPQFEGNVQTPCLSVPASRLVEMTNMAISKRFGDALKLKTECIRDYPSMRRYGDWVSTVDGEIVLRWETDANGENLVCTDRNGEFTYIGMNLWQGSFIESEEIDPGFEWWEVPERLIPLMAVFARKAWNDRQY